MTVEDNILAVLEAQPLSREERRTRTEKLDRAVQPESCAQYDGICAERGGAAESGDCALPGHRPAFILLDEPFSGIDPIAVLELQEIIFELKKNGIGSW